MRYEKKMLILSGGGKGVVMVERSALGVKFALRTFGVESDGLKAGVVTPSVVLVRDIPSGKDPSAVFYTDDVDLDALHFAVFGRELVLYGATCKKMWEANLMDVLKRHAAPVGALQPIPSPQKLPPLAQKPDKLPLPDGTGIPQSRDDIYGDDTLAESDFYTPFDLAPRMKKVDSFLDEPRALDALAPKINMRMPDPSVSAASAKAEAAAENRADISPDISPDDEKTQFGETTATSDPPGEKNITEVDTAEAADAVGNASTVGKPEAAADAPTSQPEPSKDTETSVAEKQKDRTETAENIEKAVVPERKERAEREMPWRLEARYLSGRATREPISRQRHAATKVKQRTEIPRLRDATFFELSRHDVDKLFDTAEADGELAAILPELKWVKVRFDGHSVSVGRGGTVLCYAVSGLYEKVSPFGDKAQWLPKLKNAPTGKGYWLIFQDLASGRIVGAI